MSYLSKSLLAGAIVILSMSFPADGVAQGFRLGNFMQAGGGQGFRMGGPRLGMHFGGGQGATIGGQNFGMRFGNGQGARFGGGSYGMQFGGGQGTQIGRFATQPSVAPGTYYYGNAGAQQLVVPQRTYARQVYSQPQPGVYGQPQMSGVVPAAYNQYGTGNVAIAGSPSQVATAVSVPAASASPTPTTSPSDIRLMLPADAKTSMAYKLNGSDFTLEPGKSILMDVGNEWTVEFSAGAEFGERVATLKEPGEYTFSASEDEGWVLIQVEQESDEEPAVGESLDTTAKPLVPEDAQVEDVPVGEEPFMGLNLETPAKTNESILEPTIVAPHTGDESSVIEPEGAGLNFDETTESVIEAAEGGLPELEPPVETNSGGSNK